MENYPLGAENDPNAPYNRKDTKEREFSVNVKSVLHARMPIVTADYEEEADYDEVTGWSTFCDTSNTDWDGAFYGQHFSPMNLIELLSDEMKKKLKDKNIGAEERRRAEKTVRECSYWLDDARNTFEDIVFK